MGKSRWRGIWEMFAALVFYDLVTTVVMMVWTDGAALAVQGMSALVTGAVLSFLYIRRKENGVRAMNRKGQMNHQQEWLSGWTEQADHQAEQESECIGICWRQANLRTIWQLLSLVAFLKFIHQRPDRPDEPKIHIPRLPPDRPGNCRAPARPPDFNSRSGNSLDRRADLPRLRLYRTPAFPFLLDRRRNFRLRLWPLPWKRGAGTLRSGDRPVFSMDHGKEKPPHSSMAGTCICKFNFRSERKCGKVK